MNNIISLIVCILCTSIQVANQNFYLAGFTGFLSSMCLIIVVLEQTGYFKRRGIK